MNDRYKVRRLTITTCFFLLLACAIVGANVLRSPAFKKPPFRIEETGWGEFDMLITLTAIDKGGEYPLAHDLNFQAERYESKHSIVGNRTDAWSSHSLLSDPASTDVQKS